MVLVMLCCFLVVLGMVWVSGWVDEIIVMFMVLGMVKFLKWILKCRVVFVLDGVLNGEESCSELLLRVVVIVVVILLSDL